MATIPTVAQAGSLTEAALETFLRKAQTAYAAGTPICTDVHFDRILDVMRTRFPTNKWLLAPVKPEGATSAASGAKVTLPFYMASLDKIKLEEIDPSKDHMKEWATKHPSKSGYVVMRKVDGASGMFHQGHGLYTQGSDGLVGHNLVPHLEQLQKSKRIPTNPRLATMTVRGELVVTRADFERNNAFATKELARLGVSKLGSKAKDMPQVFKTSRNLTTGVVNKSDPKSSLVSLLSFVAYEVMSPLGMSPQQQLSTLESMGFTTPFVCTLTQAELTDERCMELFHSVREESDYDCDGIVVAVNAPVTTRCKEGNNPTTAIAFKVDADGEETTVQSVEWNISRHGLYIPTVLVDMVNIEGVEIRRATGIHARYVFDNGIGPGAIVTIIRSGDVIPKIKEIMAPAPGGPQMPPEGTWRWEEPKSSPTKAAVPSSEPTYVEDLAAKAYALAKREWAPGAKAKSRQNRDAQIDAVCNVINTTLGRTSESDYEAIYIAVENLWDKDHTAATAATTTTTSVSIGSKLPIHAVAVDAAGNEDFQVKRIATFLDKIGVEEVKIGTVQKMYTAGFDTLPKILRATTTQLTAIPGFQITLAAKVVDNIRAAIQKASRIQLMVGSCTFGRGMGETKLTLILDMYPDFDVFEDKGLDEWTKDDMPKGVSIDTFREFYGNLFGPYAEWLTTVDMLLANPNQGWVGPTPSSAIAERRAADAAARAPAPTTSKAVGTKSAAATVVAKSDMTGMAFVFTGFRDADLEEQVAIRGGKISSGVSKKTTAVVAKDTTAQTGKVKDATAAGVAVLTRDQFVAQYKM